MILIFGGTTEGAAAAKVCDAAGRGFYYSTLRSSNLELLHGELICGEMDGESIIKFIREKSIKIIIDAAHPFAGQLHSNIAQASFTTSTPVIRYERKYPEPSPGNILCDNLEDALNTVKKMGSKKVLFLTGVKSIPASKEFWCKTKSIFRIIDCKESLDIVKQSRFPKENIIFWSRERDEYQIFKDISPDIIITKESGESGDFSIKQEAACRASIPLIIIKRPALPPSYKSDLYPQNIVRGRDSLRRAIEKISPSFFPLKSGITTGSCATAAAVASTYALLYNKEMQYITIELPSGEDISIKIESTEFEQDGDCTKDNPIAISTVIKESGDDPDITNGAEIKVSAQYNSHGKIEIKGGEGIGVVTLPGLGINIGEAAINDGPKRMIMSNIRRLIQDRKLIQDREIGITFTISVPKGRELALRTFNPRLGIEGGISIIGTSGIVRPFSSEAFAASIDKELGVAEALGITSIVLNSGAKSEQFAKKIAGTDNRHSFIQFGNLIGESLDMLSKHSFTQVKLVIMLGKAVKLAAGELDTHSKKRTMDIGFIKRIAKEANLPSRAIDKIGDIKLARELPIIIDPQAHQEFYNTIAQECLKTCWRHNRYNFSLEIILIDDSGNILARV